MIVALTSGFFRLLARAACLACTFPLMIVVKVSLEEKWMMGMMMKKRRKMRSSAEQFSSKRSLDVTEVDHASTTKVFAQTLLCKEIPQQVLDIGDGLIGEQRRSVSGRRQPELDYRAQGRAGQHNWRHRAPGKARGGRSPAARPCACRARGNSEYEPGAASSLTLTGAHAQRTG